MNKSESIKEIATALAKAQGEIGNATKGAVNPHFRNKYADLAEVLNTVRPVFSANGLSITQMPSYEGGMVSVETLLMHSSGEFLSSSISAPVTKQDAQGVGSAITYCRRYSLAAIAGIAQEDDDGNSAVGGPGKKQAKPPKEKIDAVVTAINSADSMDALKALWGTLDAAIRTEVKQALDNRKAALTAEEAA